MQSLFTIFKCNKCRRIYAIHLCKEVGQLNKKDKKREEDAYDIFRKIWNSRLKGQTDEKSADNRDPESGRHEGTD